MIDITNPGKIPGLLLTLYDDMGDLPAFWDSLMISIPDKYAYGIIAVDAGSTDGSIQWIKDHGVLTVGPCKDLSVALNKGIWEFVGDLVEDKGDWVYQRKSVSSVVWIHPDMRFPEVGWLGKMVEYMYAHPDIGKLHPDLIECPEGDRPGNQCPWMIPIPVLKKLQLEIMKGRKFPGDSNYKQRGWWYDEGYALCAGKEDWDLNKRILDLGYKVWITGATKISHRSMGTRSRKDNNPAVPINYSLFNRKWKQDNPFI
jgi:GT2 family glycosyltransferase